MDVTVIGDGEDTAQAPARSVWGLIGSTLWRLVVPLILAVIIFGFISLTPSNQYAVLVALVVFLATYIAPMVQMFYADKQTQIALRTEIRDKWRHARELKAANEKPELRLAFNDGNSIEFWPVGGHRRINSTISVQVYVENIGDGPASDIIVHIGLPDYVHQIQLAARKVQTINEDGSIEERPVEYDFDKQIGFGPSVLSYPLAQMVGTAIVQRRLFPPLPQFIGRITAMMPGGTYRFPWVIEAAGTIFKSTDDTALTVIVNDTAVGHDTLGPTEPAENCTFCRAYVNLTKWTMFVDTELTKVRYPIGVPNRNGTRGVIGIGTPGKTEWRQNWLDLGRRVTCELIAGRDDAVTAYFWTKPNWDDREARIIPMDNPAKFTAEMWEFLMPENAAGSVVALPGEA